MPLSALDPVTALIVVDLQRGIVDYPLLHPLEKILDGTLHLLRSFRAARLPVVLVNVLGRAPGRTEQGPRSTVTFAEGWSELLPELGRQPDDILISKHTWGAFTNTGLESLLKAKGVTGVVVTGIATSGGVEATARQAYELGFHVTLALDAITDLREEAHLYSTRNVFPRLGETGSVADIISMITERCVTP